MKLLNYVSVCLSEFYCFRVNIVCFFIVQDVRVYSEEVELDSRDAEQDYKQFKESCESLANLMSDIQNLKANGAKEGVRSMHKRKKTFRHYCYKNIFFAS